MRGAGQAGNPLGKMATMSTREPRRGRGRPKTKSDKEQVAHIVEGARKMMLEHGYAGTTTDALAARCHVSKRTIYELFPSKTELFGAVIDAHRQSLLDLPGDYDHLPLTEALEKIFRIDLDEALDQERMGFLRLLVLESSLYPELRDMCDRHGRDMSWALLGDWLRHQQARGRVSLDAPDMAAKILMDMAFGAVVVKREGEADWPGEADRKAYLRACIRIFVKGVEAGRTA